MATTSNVNVVISYSGDVDAVEVLSDGANAASPAAISIVTLSSGFNSISVPTGGSTVTSVAIVPPAGNTQTLILKGLTGDTGVGLHPTNVTKIALVSGATTIGITAGGTVTGLRLFWS